MKTVARTVLLAGVIALLGLVVPTALGGARVSPEPTADIQSVAGLAPDAQSVDVQVLASCPERWTVVEAVVTVSQPGASGQASFPLTCIGSTRLFFVTVPSAGGAFQLDDAQVTASVVINRGRTMRADDAQVLPVQPTVLALAETARLESGGEEVLADVVVACPAGTNGLLSSLVVSQAGQSIGSGAYVPICDGSQHTFTVRVEASQGLYHLGSASEPVRKRSNVGAQAERSLLGGGRQSCEGPTGACHSWARSSQRWLLP